MSWRRRRRPLAGVQELLPLEDVQRDVVRLRNGDYRAVLRTSSVNFGLKSEAEQDAILAGYRRFLNGLSFPLQVLVRVAPTDVDAYVAGLRNTPSSGGDTLRRLIRDHESFVRRTARERTLLDRRFYLVVPAEMDAQAVRRGIRWPWRRPAGAPGSSDLVAARRKLAFRCGEVMQGLSLFGVHATRLEGEALLALWRETLGGAPSPRSGALVATPVLTTRTQLEAATRA